MGQIKSTLMYGISIGSEDGEIDYSVANDLSTIALNYENVQARWSGRDGEEPSLVVIGIVLEDYNEEEDKVYVNLAELVKKEEEAKKNFPYEQIDNEITSYIEKNDLEDLGQDKEPGVIIVLMED